MKLEKEAYEQNYQQFRSLNQIMWQIPVLAMTLTVLLNAVWMHLPPNQHESSMLRIFELTKEGGAAFVSLRLGPQDDDRGMYTVSSSDFVNLAKNVGFKVIPEGDFSDLLGRPEVSWKMYRLQK